MRRFLSPWPFQDQLTDTLIFRAALVWLAFRRWPEKEFNRLFGEAMIQAGQPLRISVGDIDEMDRVLNRMSDGL